MNTYPDLDQVIDYGIPPFEQPKPINPNRLTAFDREELRLQEKHHQEALAKQDEVTKGLAKLTNALGDSKAAIYVGRKKIKPLNEFVLLFYENLREIIEEYDLNTTNLRVLLVLIEKMEFGNLVQLNQSALAKELGMQRQNLHRAFKKLKDIGLLLEIDSSLYVNPHVIAKGQLIEQKLDDNSEPTDVYAKLVKESEEKGITRSF